MARAGRRCLLLFLLFWSGRTAEARQNQGISYEGQNVATIDLSAGPTVNVDSLRPLIQQKANEPYSNAKVQATVTAIQQTGQFSGVTVQVEPVTGGLQVLFVLQPAYYIGMIYFPGALGPFPYPRLLQVADFPSEEPFIKSETETARKALLDFFAREGYFEATVEVTTETDEAHKLVNVTFHTDLNRIARIGTIQIDGVSSEESNDVRQALRSFWARLNFADLRTGKKFSPSHLHSATAFIQKRLRKEGHLAPQVRLLKPQYQEDTNRADVTYQVTLGPELTVKVSGAHLFTRTMHKLVPIFEENAYDQDLVQEGKRNITSYFQAKGFFDAKVDVKIDEQPNNIQIVYQVDKGKRHKVKHLAFQGNHYLSRAQLLPPLKVKTASFLPLAHGSYSDDLIQQSEDAIAALYKDAGFANVKVQSKVTDYEPEVDVMFIISEGPQDFSNSLRLEGDQQVPLAQLGGNSLEELAGKPFSPHRVDVDRNEIIAKYLNKGYLKATLQPKVTPVPNNPHRFDIVYQIDEGPLVHVGQVVTLGRQRTRPWLIDQIADIHSGVPLSESKLLRSESELYGLGIFDWTDIGPRKPITDQTTEDVLIKVHEAKRNSIDYGFGFDVFHRGGNVPIGAVVLPGLPVVGLGSKFTTSERTFVGPRGSIDYTRRAIGGLDHTLTVSLLGSRLDQRLVSTYADAHFRGSNWTSLLSLEGERTTENPIFAAAVVQGSFQVQRVIDRKKHDTLQFRYTFQHTTLSHVIIPDLVPLDALSVRLSTLSATFVHDTRDKPLDAHKGFYGSVDMGITPKLLGSQANFARLLGRTSYYWPVNSWLVWANNIRLGLEQPFGGSVIPLSAEFFSGGSDTLRGFPIDGAGPQRPVNVCANPSNPATCTLISVPVGGNMLAVFNSELRFPIPLKKDLGGAVFYDGGNVYSNINFHQLISQYSNSVGFGLRYNTPVGPIRLDIGRNLSPIPGVKATQYFITIGQAF
ncbi:MAG TPA: POTRA domain-containing protein [Candidatus Acidoferrales bacterium]|nr:POTRA domain-containing protein [Candidatus Acidoferrales bacterium]